MLYDYSSVFTEMDHTVKFIRELLSISPQQNLMEEKSDDSEKLDIIDSPDDLEFHPIEDVPDDFSTAAVDGGQGTVVRNNIFIAGVYRGGYVTFRRRERTGEYSSPLKLVNLTPANYSGIYKCVFQECYNRYPESYPTFTETLGRLRGLIEESCFNLALEKLNPGDLILLDGSLRVDQSDNGSFLIDFLKRAKEAGVDVAAVTKTSSLLWRDCANLVAVVKNTGDQKYQSRSWYTNVLKTYDPDGKKWLGKIYISRLNGFSDMAFRVDLSRYNVSSPKKVFAKLIALSNDSFFLGYPYPLAAVHQMVRLSEDDLLGFSLRLKDLALRKGIDERGWEILFADYHNVLNDDLKERKPRV
jgi:NurA domain